MRGSLIKMFYSGKFIGDERNSQDIKLAELARGLCSTAQLARIESGIRSAEKLLFDSLYERLGKNTERFTVLLDCDEYEQLLERIRICGCIDAGRYEEALKRIDAYRKTTKNNIHRQYLCLVECEVMHRTHASVAECMDKLMEGIRYTCPDFDIDNIRGYYLSTMEMLIVQQYVRYIEQSGQRDRAARLYRDILEFLDNDRYDRVVRAKLYGYAGYRLMQYYIDLGQYNFALEMGEKTYECITNREKWIFLTELKAGIIRCREALGEDMSDAKRVLSILQKMNDRYGVKRAEDYFPRYAEEYAVNVNEVIRKRRLMYGMTQEELAEGICDVTTISRLENNKHNLNDELRSRLLEKLKLPIDKYSPCVEDNFDDKMNEKLRRASAAIKRGQYGRLTKMPDMTGDKAVSEALRQVSALGKSSDGILVFENEWGIIDDLVFYCGSAGGQSRIELYGSVFKPAYIDPMPYECEIAGVLKNMEEGELLRELGNIEAAGEKLAGAIKLAVKVDEFEWLSRLFFLYAQNILERKEWSDTKEEEGVELLEYSYALASVYDDRRRIDAIRALCSRYDLKVPDFCI